MGESDWNVSVASLLNAVTEYLWENGETVLPECVEVPIEGEVHRFFTGDVFTCRSGLVIKCVTSEMVISRLKAYAAKANVRI